MEYVKTDEPITSESVTRTIQALTDAYPMIRSRLLGQTNFARPIWAMSLGTGAAQMIFAAAFHANEWITAPVLLQFAQDYAQAIAQDGTIGGQSARRLSASTTIHLVPLVNPDGVDLVTGALPQDSAQYQQALSLARNYPNIPFPDGWKANLGGVDLNLQFPAGWLMAREIKFRQGYTQPGPRDYVGRAPLSQPESLLLLDFTVEVDPALVVALHTQGQEIYYQYNDVQVPGARELAEEMGRRSGYTVTQPGASSSYAGYKDWFIQEYRRPGFTIEAGLGVNPLPLAQFPEIYQDVLPILLAAAESVVAD